MPVLAKFHGIVMRMMCHWTFGTHLHAIYGEDELVIGLKPVRIIQGEVPPWVSALALRQVVGGGQGLPIELPPTNGVGYGGCLGNHFQGVGHESHCHSTAGS